MILLMYYTLYFTLGYHASLRFEIWSEEIYYICFVICLVIIKSSVSKILFACLKMSEISSESFCPKIKCPKIKCHKTMEINVCKVGTQFVRTGA